MSILSVLSQGRVVPAVLDCTHGEINVKVEMKIRQTFFIVSRTSYKAPDPGTSGTLESCRRSRRETNNADGRNFAASIRYRGTGSSVETGPRRTLCASFAHSCDPGDAAPSSRGRRTMEVRPLPAAGGIHMSQRSLRRHLTAGVLATVLLGATPAHARDLGTTGNVWGWMQEVWTRGVSALWERGAGVARRERPAGDQRKEGNGLDPNGGMPPRPSSATTGCGLCIDQGNGLDPNG